MTERSTIHTDVGGYLLGSLSPEEAARFESHLVGCAAYQQTVRELEPGAALLLEAAPAQELPIGLRERTLAAVERAAQAEGASAVGADGRGRASSPNTSEGRRDTARRRRPWLRRGGLALAGAAVLALGVLAGVAIERPGGTDPTPLELRAVLTAPGDAARRATVGVTKTGIGRVIDLRTDDLPILPKGEYYELWWVGPGDRPGRPNRISAGTFHPDQQGRSIVTFAAAVDPKKYPTLAVTAEPGDGDPRPSTPDALRSRPEK